MVLLRCRMALLQILLDRYFVLGLLRSGGERAEFLEQFGGAGFAGLIPAAYYIKRLKMRSGQKKI